MIKDIYPLKAQFNKEEEIQIVVELDDTVELLNSYLLCTIFNLHHQICEIKKEVLPSDKVVKITFKLDHFKEEELKIWDLVYICY